MSKIKPSLIRRATWKKKWFYLPDTDEWFSPSQIRRLVHLEYKIGRFILRYPREMLINYNK